MDDELVVVFVLVDEVTQRYLGPMMLAELGSDDGKNVAAIGADGFFYMKPGQDQRPFDILLLPDSDLTDESEQMQILTAQAGNKRKVFVAYHTGSPSMEQQSKKMRETFGANLVPWSEHHDKGCVFDSLIELAASGSGTDRSRYETVVACIVACCKGNAELEARLELLHLCLTPEGAALLLGDELPDSIPPHVRGRVSELKLIKKDGRTVSEMISELVRHDSDPFDASEGGYMEKLRAIREVLLGENSASEGAPTS